MKSSYQFVIVNALQVHISLVPESAENTSQCWSCAAYCLYLNKLDYFGILNKKASPKFEEGCSYTKNMTVRLQQEPSSTTSVVTYWQSKPCNVLTVPLWSQSMRARAVSGGSWALRPSLSSWLGWSSKASLRSSANWTTCIGPVLTGEPSSYMLLENSIAAAFEPDGTITDESCSII